MDIRQAHSHASGRRIVAVSLTTGCAGNQVNQYMNQGLKPGRESGLVTNTILNKVSPRLERAWIYEIDGEPVSYTRRTFRLPIGEHTIKVWPLDNAPRSQQLVPDENRILREEIVVEELTIDIEPGYRYYLGREDQHHPHHEHHRRYRDLRLQTG